MTNKRMLNRITWTVIVALLLVAAFMIVRRNGPIEGDTPAGFIH